MKHIAVITGASSGMGREFVRQLDGQFDELWGIALEKDLLEKVKEEIKTTKVREAKVTNKSTKKNVKKDVKKDE